MRKISILLALAGLGLASWVAAQSPRGSAELAVGEKKISIDYGRPSLKGRDMLGKAPAGYVWRMGADQATVITTDADLVFGGTTVPKGSYSLFAKRVDDKSWQLVFNKQTGQWGTQHDAGQDFATAPLSWTKQDASTEQFTIELAPGDGGGELRLKWGEDLLVASFKTK